MLGEHHFNLPGPPQPQMEPECQLPLRDGLPYNRLSEERVLLLWKSLKTADLASGAQALGFHQLTN